jgi:putative tryptophan/tyrosine transport system substrate-binding protein
LLSFSSFATLAEAQPARLPLIAVLDPGFASTRSVGTAYFKRALEQLRWAEGRTVRFETRYGEYEPDRTAVMARKLVALKPDVFYTSSDGPVRAAMQATTSIPIVVGAVADLVALGGVQSLARPGGNVTGVTHAQHGLDRKRLEILKEAVPSVSRIAYLFDPRAIPETALRALNESASQLKVQLQRVGVNKPDQGSNASSTRPRIASSQVSRATSTSSTARASG